MDLDCQFVFLGSGNKWWEDFLFDLASEAPEKFGIKIGYDNRLAHQIEAGSDIYLMPSMYEPCGLTDYIAQLLGNLPIVHQVGGLVKVIDGQTGFSYKEHTPESLAEALDKALQMYKEDKDTILKLQRQAVQQIRDHHTWEKVMQQYLELYSKAIEKACVDPARGGE